MEEEQEVPIHVYDSPKFSRGLLMAVGLPATVEIEAHRPAFRTVTTSGRHHPSASGATGATVLPISDRTCAKREFGSESVIDTERTALNTAYTYRLRTNSFDFAEPIVCQSCDIAMSGQPSGSPHANRPIVDGLTAPSVSHTLEEIAEAPGTPPPASHHHIGDLEPDALPEGMAAISAPPLKLLPLAVLVFYNVSGGPFGIEPSIRAGGNFYAILGFLIFPFIFSIPEALVTAELGSAFQDPSAGVAWVEEAFGERMGSLCGYLNWVSGATDNAIYPTLFLEYVTSVFDIHLEGIERFIFVAAITLFLSLLNYAGLEIVGNASLVVCIIAMSPFVLLTILGAPKVDPKRWWQMPEATIGATLFDDDFQTAPGPLPLFHIGGIIWRPYLNNMFWNLNSFDAAASFASETTSVSTTYPRGIFLGLILCFVFYFVPLLVAVGATDYTQEEWVDGHLGSVAVDIGGQWLGGWTILAAGISNLALFEAEMSADAFQLMGMAERGYLPKIFQKRSKYGTPMTGIAVGTMVILAFGMANFDQLLELLNVNYAISLLMEYAAFVKLRLCRKDIERPYRIPLPDWAAVLFVLLPTFGILCLFAISNWTVYAFSIGAILLGISFQRLGSFFKRRGWFTYETRTMKYGQYESTLQCTQMDDDASGSTMPGDLTVSRAPMVEGSQEKRSSPLHNPTVEGLDLPMKEGGWEYNDEGNFERKTKIEEL